MTWQHSCRGMRKYVWWYIIIRNWIAAKWHQWNGPLDQRCCHYWPGDMDKISRRGARWHAYVLTWHSIGWYYVRHVGQIYGELTMVTNGRLYSNVNRRYGYVCCMHDDVIKWKHFRVTGPLCGEFTGHWWIPLTKASDAELWCFLWSAPEQTVEQTIETTVIWDASVLIMTSQ